MSDLIKFYEKEILRHKKLYYAGEPEIGDYEYDRLEDALRKLSPSHPILRMVGYDENYTLTEE